MATKSGSAAGGGGSRTTGAGLTSRVLTPQKGEAVGGGAGFQPRYHDHQPDIVGVDVDDLEDFKSSSLEEFGQFAFGEFLIAGAFWLGLARAVSSPSYKQALLFWVCVIAFVSGMIIAWFGLRQMSRRQGKLDKIIARAKRTAK